jgi:hypothetical protein
VLAAHFIAVMPALACSCAGGVDKYGCGTPVADVIVLARVISIQRDPSMAQLWGRSVTVTLDVLEHFRGAPAKMLAVGTENDTAACGFPFQAGKEYLVFATEFQGKLTVSFCSATQPAKAAAARIRQLRAMRDRIGLPALFGSVLTSPPEQRENAEEDVQPAPNLRVVAESGGREYRTLTASDGVYEFHGIPPGEYFVHVDAPAGRVVLWSGGVERVRTPAGLEPRCPVNFQVSGHR